VTYGLDETMRIFGIRNQCEIIVENMEDETYEYLMTYAEGVNKFVELNFLPYIFHLFWINFEKWTPVDSCSCLKFLHLGLSNNWGYEMIIDYVSAISGDDQLAEELYAYDYDFFKNHTVPIISDEELKEINLFRKYQDEEKPSGFRISDLQDYLKNITDSVKEFITVTATGGSNSWVISGNHTKSGKPLFVNDPHLKNILPTTWHISHQEFPDGSFIVGGMVPVVPLYAVFSTDNITSGITQLFADSSDLYEEKIQNNTYLFHGDYLRMELKEEIIKVRWEEDRKYIVRSTHHGPLINKNSFLMSQVLPTFPFALPKGEFSLRWTGMNPYMENSFESCYKGQFSSNAFEMLELLRRSKGMSQNIIFADKYNNIAFGPSGHHPIRVHPQLGNRISRGWMAENEWEGFYSYHDKPYLLNPKKGYIVAANNPLTSPNSKTKIAVFTVGKARANRISELIEDLIARKSGQIEYSGKGFFINRYGKIVGRYKGSICRT
jgi:penicillin G amidase